MIKFIYLDSIDINKREHFGYSHDLGIVKIYGNLEASSGDIINLDGDVMKSLNSHIITDIKNVVLCSKNNEEQEDVEVPEDIINYQKRCFNFFLNQGLRKDMLRQKVLLMLPAYLDGYDRNTHLPIIKAYVKRLGYAI